ELAVGPFENEGEVYAIDDLPFYRGTGKKRVERFGTLRIAPPKASTARIPPRLREIAPLVTGTASVTRTVELGFKVSLRRGFDFVIDGERHHHAEPVNVGEMQVWDVVNMPPKTTVRIVWYPDDRPGMWMYHCHILE